MQLLSSGLRAQLGRALHRPLGPPGVTPNTGGRSIHTPSGIPRASVRSSGTSVEAFARHARALLSRVLSDLSAPGAFNLSSHASRTSGPSYSANPYRLQTIQQRLNGPTRVTLSRPLGAPYMPRAPAIPRNVAHIGLGTARNFSSARPLFQNIAENFPIAGRAFWEADWDLQLQKEREKINQKKCSKGKNRSPKKLQFKEVRPTASAPTEETELDLYFPTPALAVADVTAVLLIPLAPTPTSRLPLPTNPSVHTSNHPLLPFSYLMSVHDDHALHTLRVSSLFARLDTARVFEEPGVTCSAFGHSTGLCTILEVKFSGWSESRVRGILGEAGTGWCVLEEIRENDHATTDEALSEMSFNTRSNSPSPERGVEIDPAASFVLPTLDFSASFPVAGDTGSWAGQSTQPVLHPMSDTEFHNAWSSYDHGHSESGSDALSDIETVSLGASASSWGDAFVSSPSRRSSADGWTSLGFSSTFSTRIQTPDIGPGTDEP